jgi:hypothetical protein
VAVVVVVVVLVMVLVMSKKYYTQQNTQAWMKFNRGMQCNRVF